MVWVGLGSVRNAGRGTGTYPTRRGPRPECGGVVRLWDWFTTQPDRHPCRPGGGPCTLPPTLAGFVHLRWQGTGDSEEVGGREGHREPRGTRGTREWGWAQGRRGAPWFHTEVLLVYGTLDLLRLRPSSWLTLPPVRLGSLGANPRGRRIPDSPPL